MQNIRFYISPFYIVRGPLLRDIKNAQKIYNFQGNILDVGCGEMPYKSIFYNSNYYGIDFKNFSKYKEIKGTQPDYFFDSNYLEDFKLPFKNEEFDNVFSFQVLEHHKNPQIFLQELNRVIKKDGMVMVSCPFIEGIHESPHDYQRYTKFGLEEIFHKNGFKVEKIFSQGKFFSVIYFLFSEMLNSLASRSKLHYFLTSIIYLLLFLPIQYLAIISDKLVKTDAFVITYLVVAKKL